MLKKTARTFGVGLMAAAILFAGIAPAITQAKAVSKGSFTISVSSWFLSTTPQPGQKGPNYALLYEKTVDKLFKQAYPNATVRWDALVGESYFSKLAAQLQTNSADDVIFTQTNSGSPGTDVGSLAKAGYIASLNNLSVVKQIEPGYGYATNYEGKTYAIPLDVDSEGVFYNKSVFTKLHLTVPHTWAQFVAVCAKIAASGTTPIAEGFKDSWVGPMVFNMLATSAEFGTNRNFEIAVHNGKASLDSAPLKETFGEWQSLASKGYFNKNDMSIPWMQSLSIFMSGQAAMIIQGDWTPGIAAGMNAKFARNIGFFPVPGPVNTILPVSINHELTVNAHSRHIQADENLVEDMSSPKAVRFLDLMGYTFHGIKTIPLADALPATAEVAADLSKYPTSYPAGTFVSGSAESDLAQALSSITAGESMSAQQIAAVLLRANQDNQKDKATVIVP